MIDLHCHILPGLDDGPERLDQSLAMAELAVADGISTIVATPHILGLRPDSDQIFSAVAALNQELKMRRISLNILPGAEVFASASPARLKDCTLNCTKYLLVEFPRTHLPVNARQILANLRTQGYLPIVAHPERIPSVIVKPTLIYELSEYCYGQLTAGSLIGDFGPQVKRCAEWLLKKGLISFLATDAHSSNGRHSNLTAGFAAAAGIVGRQAAEILVSDNPARVIAGEPIV